MTDDLEVGPPVLKIDVEVWHYLAVRRDLVPLLLALGRYHRRSGIPAGSELEHLLAALAQRFAESGSSDQVGAECGNAGNGQALKLYTVHEISLLSGLSCRTVRGLAGHELPGRRSSAGWLLEADAVEKWLAERGN
jgi:hypothetical protein